MIGSPVFSKSRPPRKSRDMWGMAGDYVGKSLPDSIATMLRSPTRICRFCRKRLPKMYVYIYIYIHTYTYTYIYIFICVQP